MSVERAGRPVAERAERVGMAVMDLSAAMQGYRSWTMDVVGLSIRAPKVRGDEFLVTVRGLDSDGAPYVAFHSAVELDDALSGLHARLLNGSLKWRPDEYAGKR